MTTVVTLVGGPSGGMRFRVHEGERSLEINRPQHLPIVCYPKNVLPSDTCKVVRDLYTPRVMNFKDQRMIIWVHEPMTDFEAMIELLNGYVPRLAWECV